MGERALATVAGQKGLIGGPFGSSLVGVDYVDSGVPVVRGANMIGRFVGGDFVFVTKDKFDRDLARNNAVPGDLVFTQRGTLGQVAIVPDLPYSAYAISQSQMRLRVDAAKAHPMFVYYACSASRFLKQVQDNAISTGVPHINLGILTRLTIPELSLPEQRAIAEVLGALDDKIAANDRIVSAADELARVEFRRALVEGCEAPLSSLARFVNGRAFTKGATGTGRMVVRIAELNNGPGGSTVYNELDVAEDHLARPGDLLFAWSGSLTAARWYRGDAIVNQHIFKVIPNDGWPMWLVNQAVHEKLDEFKAIAADKATTMGHIQRRHLDDPVALPPREAIAALDAKMSGLWRRALAAERETLSLAGTRDELLPLLMSGKVRVKDAEQAVEEVT